MHVYLQVQNVIVEELKVFLGGETAPGIGDVYVTGPPAKFATVFHMGSGNVMVSANSAEVRLAGNIPYGDVPLSSPRKCEVLFMKAFAFWIAHS